MHFSSARFARSSLSLIVAGAALAIVAPRVVHAEALLVVEADTGKVLQAENATYPWYPASVTKLMTAYVTLKAVKEGRLSLEGTLTVSPVAASQSPSKMGFKPGTQVTVENALKMMMVKSANDMAVVLAEGVGGSIDGFSAQMNQTAHRLGMTQTSYVNPNGLPADGQITSARDLAILARAIIRDLPEYEYFMHTPSIRFGRRVTQNFNKLIGRYPGADGFKTGFICASGYNLVASATRNGKRLIAVVLGSSSGPCARCARRNCSSAALPTTRCRGCGPRSARSTIWCRSTLRRRTCATRCAAPKRKRPATDEDDDTVASNAQREQRRIRRSPSSPPDCRRRWRSRRNCWRRRPRRRSPSSSTPDRRRPATALIAAVAVDEQKQATRPRGKKSRVAAKKPEAAETKQAGKETKSEAKSEAKSDSKPAAKPAPSGRPTPSRTPLLPRPRKSRWPQPTSPPPSRPSPRRRQRQRSRPSPRPPKSPPQNLPRSPRPRAATPSLLTRSLPPRRHAANTAFGRSDRPFLTDNASIARSRLPSAAALLNTGQNKASRPVKRVTNQRGSTMERIWLKQYPAGVPADIDVTQYTSLVELLEESFKKFADRKAFICMDKSISYRDLDEMSQALGAYLQSKGLAKGARVALMMPNVLQYPVSTAAVLRAGYAVVNVNPLYTPRELEHQLKDSGAEAIIVLENFATTVQQVIAQDRGQACHRRQHGRPARLQGRDRQSGGAAGEEDGAGLFASGLGRLQRRALGRPRHEAEQAEAHAR